MKMFFKNGLWYGNRSGESHSGTFREVWLWIMGYGKDQAAELRYETARLKQLKINQSEGYMKELKELKVVFYGADDWDRPIFRDVYEEGGKYRYGKKFFGDTDHLFRGFEELIERYKAGVGSLCYFGSFFGCEPEGDRPEDLGLKLIFDSDLTQKIYKGEIYVV